MSQFCIHRNTNPSNRAEVPYLLDVQHSLLSHLETRVVIPLYRDTTLKRQELSRLVLPATIEGEEFLLVTSQLAGIPAKYVGLRIADISARRAEIIAALDMLISGI